MIKTENQVKRLTPLDKQLLECFQNQFPLTTHPYADMADALGVTESLVLERLTFLRKIGVISRVGAVFKHQRVGVSTLAAMEVPAQRMEEVAAMINQRTEVNHNYEREHRFNLWFVVTAKSEVQLHYLIDDIQQQTGLTVFSMPMETDFHINLGFPLVWH